MRCKFRERAAVYHCMSRTVNGDKVFGDREREMLKQMIWRVAAFSGVHILTYCVMPNHFHVLVSVIPESEVSDAELVNRCAALYPEHSPYATLRPSFVQSVLKADGREAELLRKRLRARMGDVSMFMKTLKQRFTTWFNAHHVRYGPLWSDRFKSVLVQSTGNRFAMLTTAAYIDLNPVRAGLCEDPKDYQWSGYGEAVAGRACAKSGLQWVMDGKPADEPEKDKATDAGSALARYRICLFGKGTSAKEGKAGIAPEAYKKVLAQHGTLSKLEIHKHYMRHITDGAIFGAEAFVAELVGMWKGCAQNRTSPAPLKLDPYGEFPGPFDLAIVKRLRERRIEHD